MQNRWLFFSSPRGENTFGSVQSPLPPHRKPFSPPSEGEKAPNSSNCWRCFSLGEACRLSAGTEEGAPSFLGRGSLEEREAPLDLLEVQVGREGQASSRDKQPSEHRHSREKRPRERSRRRRSRPRRSPLLHSTPQLEEEKVWPFSPPPPAKAEGLSSGCFTPGPSLPDMFSMQKNHTRGAALEDGGQGGVWCHLTRFQSSWRCCSFIRSRKRVAGKRVLEERCPGQDRCVSIYR